MRIVQIESIDDLSKAYKFVQSELLGNNQHTRDLDFYIKVYQEKPDLLIKAIDQHNQIIGVILGSVEDNHVLIGELVVASDHRGRGLGTNLLEALEDKTRNLGINALLLGAREEAENFYLKNDYQPKLFVQINQKEFFSKLDNLLQFLPANYRVTWKEKNENVYKVIIETYNLDKGLENTIRKELKKAHTQYLFTKQIN